MKNLILTFALLFSAAGIFASNGIGTVEGLLVFSNEAIDCQLADEDGTWFITEMSHSSDTNDFFISTNENVRFIQLIDANEELIYQIPVGNKKIYLSLNDLDVGAYQLNMLMEESKTMVVSTIQKK